MICRHILQTKDLQHFDYFNDADDTIRWLRPIAEEDKMAKELLEKLEEGKKEFFKNWAKG